MSFVARRRRYVLMAACWTVAALVAVVAGAVRYWPVPPAIAAGTVAAIMAVVSWRWVIDVTRRASA